MEEDVNIPVIFRMSKETGEVEAFFPTAKWSDDLYFCYDGMYAGASYRYYRERTTATAKDVYTPMLRNIEFLTGDCFRVYKGWRTHYAD